MRSMRGVASRGRWPRVAGAVAVVLVATGCGPGVADDPGAVAAAAPASAAVHCPTTAKLSAPRAEQPVPAGFATAWVLRCGSELRSVAGQGKWVFRIEERADTDAAELVAALRRPDAQPAAEDALRGRRVRGRLLRVGRRGRDGGAPAGAA